MSVRLLQGDSLSHDEAEQVITSSHFALGYLKQPPLYSWLLFAVSKFTPLNLYSLTLVKYLVYFLTLSGFYILARKFLDQRLSLLATSSILLLITYSYDFNRDLTHTILVTGFSILSLIIYLNLIDKPKTSNYLLLGLCFALGFLAKYNFIFIVLAILMSAITTQSGKRIFFDYRTILSMLVCLLVLSPHLSWILAKNFSTVNYALERAHDSHHLSTITSLEMMYLIYYEIFIALALLYLIWMKRFGGCLSKVNLVESDALTQIRVITLYAFFIPKLFIILGAFDQFYPKWLSTVEFVFILFFFTRYSFEYNAAFKATERKHYLLITLLILVIAGIELFGYYQPDLVGKAKSYIYPYKTVSQSFAKELEARGFDSTNTVILVAHNSRLMGNLALALPPYSKIKIRKLHGYLTKPHKNKKNVILVWAAESNKSSLPKDFQEAFPTAEIQQPVSAPMINSKKHRYSLFWALAK